MAGVQPDRPAESSAVQPTHADASPGWQAWFDERRRAVDAAISNHMNLLKAEQRGPDRVLEAVEYSLLQRGKRLRPILVLESARVCDGDEPSSVNAAIAIECVHTFSLIHDDLPAIDDDDLRRGRPTNHMVFGEALAVLAGDWLLAHAFELLAANRTPAEVVPAVTAALAGGTQAMIIGQAADIAGEQQPADKSLVEFIHRNKTARLFEAAAAIGARLAGAPQETVESMTAYGRHLGLAFQIVDDLLDRSGSSAALGKRVGKDEQRSKQTYPAAFGEAAGRTRAAEEIDAAIAVLEPLGPRAENLRGLARFVTARDR